MNSYVEKLKKDLSYKESFDVTFREIRTKYHHYTIIFLNFLINFYQLPLQLLFHFLPLLFPATAENCRNMSISAVNRSDLKCIRTVL